MLTFDDITNPSGYIFFTDVPNILAVEEENSGVRANIHMHIEPSLASATTRDGQWYITINGETITNVMNPDNAINKNFYISDDEVSTAYSITKALRNCPTISANFNIPTDLSDDVYVRAKKIGNTPIEIQTNTTGQIYINTTGGTSSSSLDNALVDVQIEKDGEYVTTLEKTAYNASTAFDLSPVLSTIAEYGEAVPFTLTMATTNSGSTTSLGSISGNHIVNGYKANDSYDYLYRNSILFAQNIAGKLYIYDNHLPVSFFNPENNGGATVTFTYLDSMRNTIYTETSTWHNTDSSRKLKELEYTLNANYLASCAFFIISVGNTSAEYEIIKPVKATEGFTRVLWRNEYGGISLFDFTGEKSMSDAITNEEYRKNNFDYYIADLYEDRKLYDKKAVRTVTLKSHIMGKDGIWIFNSLKKAKKVWTNDNKAIIINSVQVDEQDNNDVYVATITYTYSNEEND